VKNVNVYEIPGISFIIKILLFLELIVDIKIGLIPKSVL